MRARNALCICLEDMGWQRELTRPNSRRVAVMIARLFNHVGLFVELLDNFMMAKIATGRAEDMVFTRLYMPV